MRNEKGGANAAGHRLPWSAAVWQSGALACCVPGLARLLIGDVRYYDTCIGQSPYPARRRRRIAEGKGVAAMCAWRKPEAKAWVDVQVCPVPGRVEGRQIWGGARSGRVRNTGQSPLSVIWPNHGKRWGQEKDGVRAWSVIIWSQVKPWYSYKGEREIVGYDFRCDLVWEAWGALEKTPPYP
jgi:hypothetical protein